MQENNAREIVQQLAADPHYFGTLCAALRAVPTGAPGEPAAAPAAAPAPAAEERWGGCGEPRPPESESRALQLWGLLVELCTMAAPLHVIQRAAVYRALCCAGLLQVAISPRSPLNLLYISPTSPPACCRW